MILLAIDPGGTNGVCVYDSTAKRVLHAGELSERELIVFIMAHEGGLHEHTDALVYESWQFYGRAPHEPTTDMCGYLRLHLGGVGMTRPAVLRALGLGTVKKAAVWAEIVRMLGSDRGGKLCPNRRRQAALRVSRDKQGLPPPVCPACGGTGWEREPGPLAMFRGKPHAKDALTLAVAYSIEQAKPV
jgi:hypothetical protein